ncbi:MAG TPA: zinc-ribbon domain-containing protein [Desulfosarcina sp.]|nr:zinc-ribbon domain-containing protein [Desulfosarcina sp.]
MDILCESCQSKFRIADEKLPKDRTAFLKCPKCKHRISVPPAGKGAEEGGQTEFEEDFFSFDEDEGEGYDASDKPFDFVEEEGKTALLCESDPMIKKAITPVLEVLEYHIT